MTRPLRYTDRPLPAYRHVPGRTPHPTNHPRGHSFGAETPPPPPLGADAWWASPTYLYGVDLFNQWDWWECHEVFESLWLATGRSTDVGQGLQALIQCAVAHLKTDVGNHRGARKLLENAERHMRAAGTSSLGGDYLRLLEETGAYVSGASTRPATLRLDFPTRARGSLSE